MKKCTWCGKEYGDEEIACAIDQHPLVPFEQRGANPTYSTVQSEIPSVPLQKGVSQDGPSGIRDSLNLVKRCTWCGKEYFGEETVCSIDRHPLAFCEKKDTTLAPLAAGCEASPGLPVKPISDEEPSDTKDSLGLVKKCTWCGKQYPQEETVCAIDRHALVLSKHIEPSPIPPTPVREPLPSPAKPVPSGESATTGDVQRSLEDTEDSPDLTGPIVVTVLWGLVLMMGSSSFRIIMAPVCMGLLIFFAWKRGFNPWFWMFIGLGGLGWMPLLGFVSLLFLPAASEPGLSQSDIQKRRIRGAVIGGILSGVVALLFLFVIGVKLNLIRF